MESLSQDSVFSPNQDDCDGPKTSTPKRPKIDDDECAVDEYVFQKFVEEAEQKTVAKQQAQALPLSESPIPSSSSKPQSRLRELSPQTSHPQHSGGEHTLRVYYVDGGPSRGRRFFFCRPRPEWLVECLCADRALRDDTPCLNPVCDCVSRIVRQATEKEAQEHSRQTCYVPLPLRVPKREGTVELDLGQVPIRWRLDAQHLNVNDLLAGHKEATGGDRMLYDNWLRAVFYRDNLPAVEKPTPQNPSNRS